jgi:hypothetical protein
MIEMPVGERLLPPDSNAQKLPDDIRRCAVGDASRLQSMIVANLVE